RQIPGAQETVSTRFATAGLTVKGSRAEMKQQITFGSAIALCGLVFAALAAPAAHAQPPAMPVAGAIGDASPTVWVLVNGGQGAQYSSQLSQQYRALLANTTWAFWGSGQFVMSKNNSVLLGADWWGTQDGSLFLIHDETSNAEVDGWVTRSSVSSGTAQ